MIFETFDINTGNTFDKQRYDTEKERKHLVEKARNDMRNSPGSEVWFVDVTPSGITTGKVEL